MAGQRFEMIKDRTAAQSTQTLCEAVVLIAAQPRSDETNLVRAVMLDVLCERHPEAHVASEAWAESDTEDDLTAVVVSAALAAIGA